MSGQSLGFVVIETTRREGFPDDIAVCAFLPGGEGNLLPGEREAERERDRLAAHAAVDADLHEGASYAYTVAEVVSR